MGVVIFIIVVLFVYWSLVPAKPKNRSFSDIVKDSERRSGKFSNVYKHKYTGVYYSSIESINNDDEIVFSGTQTECESYSAKKNGDY